ncbi:MAG: hypothetical protein HEQ23_13250 [Tepidisphaera sp.]
MPAETESSRPPIASAAALVVLTAAVLGLPLVGLVADSLSARSGKDSAWWWLSSATLARTLGWSVLIGGLAAGLGLPLAWACRNTRTVWLVLLLAPAAFPSFLAYSGWGMLRAPLSATGDFIGFLRDHGVGNGGWEWLPGAVDTGLAVAGLAFWAAPLAAMAMLPGIRAVTDDTLDASRLECSGVPRARFVVRALAGPIGFGVMAVAAIMLGSAVPLHLARVETASILLWSQLDLTPPDRHWRVWVAAWPLVVAAGLLARGVSGLGARSSAGDLAEARFRRTPWVVGAAALVVAAMGTLVPMGFFAFNLRSLGSVGRYLRDHDSAVSATVLLAVCSAGVGTVLALSAWHAASNGRGALVRRVAVFWTFWGLLPGVMVGSAVARGFIRLDLWVLERLGMSAGDTVVPILAGQAARFGFIPVWMGLWLAVSEPAEVRDQRRLDGAEAVQPWFAAAGRGSVGAVVAVAAGMFALSLHEIESAVLTLWPGGSLLSRIILNDLHFFRTQELAAGVVLLAGMFVPAAVIAVVFARRRGVG